MGPIGFPETSVTNYQSMLLNIPEERKSKFISRRKPEITQSASLDVIQFSDTLFEKA
jgi:hypothetical protein